MNTFYLRLLLAFLVANFVVLGISILGTRVLLNDKTSDDAFNPRVLQAQLREVYAEDALNGLEKRVLRESLSHRIIYITVDGELHNRTMSPPLRNSARSLEAGKLASIELPPPGEVLWLLPITPVDASPSIAVLVHERPGATGSRRTGPHGRDGPDSYDRPPRRSSAKGARSKQSGSFFGKARKETYAVYLGLLIVGIAIAGWVVARSLTAPLRSVQTTINRFAHGDLSARVGEHLTSRGDDMGRLAGDFDRMANGVEKMIQSRDRLLHQLSHEMRSPLARLRFAIELARGKNEGDETYLHKADLEIDRLNALMDEMLQLARAERLPNERRPQSLSVDELLDEAIERTALAAEERRVTLVRAGETGITLLGQADLLARAMDNVLGNALKYSPEGEQVDLSAHKVDGTVEIRIADKGPGVPRSELDDLFEPFYRASNSSQDGYGLGLAIVASALRAHNGRARATLRAGGGLEVVLSIPLIDGPRDA